MFEHVSEACFLSPWRFVSLGRAARKERNRDFAGILLLSGKVVIIATDIATDIKKLCA